MGAVFALYSGWYFWIPKILGLDYNLLYSKAHFWVLFAGVNITFFPQHFLGLQGMPRRISDYPDAFTGWNFISSIGSIISVVATALFLQIVYLQLVEGKAIFGYPWAVPQLFSDYLRILKDKTSPSLEWALHNPPKPHAFTSLPLQSTMPGSSNPDNENPDDEDENMESPSDLSEDENIDEENEDFEDEDEDMESAPGLSEDENENDEIMADVHDQAARVRNLHQKFADYQWDILYSDKTEEELREQQRELKAEARHLREELAEGLSEEDMMNLPGMNSQETTDSGEGTSEQEPRSIDDMIREFVEANKALWEDWSEDDETHEEFENDNEENENSQEPTSESENDNEKDKSSKEPTNEFENDNQEDKSCVDTKDLDEEILFPIHNIGILFLLFKNRKALVLIYFDLKYRIKELKDEIKNMKNIHFSAFVLFVIIGISLLMGYNYNLTNILCDAPRAWGLYFQDSASPQMEALVELHNNIMFYLVAILFIVAWIQGSIVKNFDHSIARISNKYVNHGTLIELIWTITPALILVLIAFPSFKLLYLMDEVTDPSLSVVAEGHQWYWSYEYPDFLNSDGDFIEFDSYLVPESDLEKGSLRMLEVDNRVILPEITHTRFIVTAADVIHSFAIPALGVKCDAYPGRLNQFSVLINRLGTFYGQCSEICGILHSSMPIVVESVSLEKFLSWLQME